MRTKVDKGMGIAMTASDECLLRYINSDDIVTFKKDPYFWNALLFLTFYLGTFLSWGMIHMLVRHNVKAAGVVYLIVYLLNLVFYNGLGVVALMLNPSKVKIRDQMYGSVI